MLDSLLDPRLLLEAVRDASGRIVDFDVEDASGVACAHMRVTSPALVGSRMLDQLPARAGREMLTQYAEALDSGQTLALDDAPHPHELQRTDRRYDIRVVPLGDALALSWRDVTDRHAAEERSQAGAALAAAEEQFRVVMDGAPIGMCLVSPEGRFLRVNTALCRMLGRTAEELLDLTWRELTHRDDLDVDSILFQDVLDGRRRTYRRRKRYVAPDGTVIWAAVSVGAVRNDDDSVRYCITQIVDVTERVADRRSLADSEELLRVVLDNSQDATLRFDRQARVEYVNRRVVELSGVPASSWIGRTIAELDYPPTVVAAWTAHVRAVLVSGVAGTFEYEVDNATGRHWYEASLAPVPDSDGTIAHVIATSRNVTERRIAEAELRHLATHDPLTGLANRAALLDEIGHALCAGRRSGRSTAVLMIDLDNFKNVNDSLGHAAGDELLKAVARRIESSVRGGDLVARHGGDEFVVVMRDLDSDAEPSHTAMRLVSEFRKPFRAHGSELYATASIGIAIASDSSEADDLVREADTAMYVAKSHGRDRVWLFNENLREAVAVRLAVEGSLRHALERDELAVWYQPEVDLRTGTVIAVEALLRWHHPDGGLYTADRFIEVAEDTGLIRGIGDWVLQQACAQAARWTAVAREVPLTMRVNLSALQLAEANLLGTIDTALDASGLDPGLLCLEITETTLLRNTATVVTNLAGISERGIHVAIDDFGTGYASLSYLRQYTIDVLKIDRSFVTTITTSDRNLRLVSGILALARQLDITVTAEGIEERRQADLLRELGCPGAQGFLYSPAVPPEQITALLGTVFQH